MPTLNQLIKNPRTKKKSKKRVKAFEGNPLKRGVCLKVTTIKPKKPNSAQRKIAKILLSNQKKITAYISGQGHNLQEHSVVLVRGGRVKDIPGMRYRLIRGVLDFDWREKFDRKTKRSKHGKIKN